jgi:beta-lactamase class D
MMVALAGCAGAPQTSPAERHLEHPDLRALLDTMGYGGSIVVYDATARRWHTVYGARADSGWIPASTFKILNSLVALDAGLVESDRALLAWDGVERERRELNRGLTLTEAFRISAVPHYQALARAAGPDRMQRALEAVQYGNRDISGGIDQFWLTGALRVSPRGQVELLHGLRDERLPFSQRAQRAVKRMMVVDSTAGYVVRAKTGWAQVEHRNVGWWVGWVEHGDAVHFFASVIEGPRPDPHFGAARTAIPRAVLERLRILPPA